jgi:hypothetical protein
MASTYEMTGALVRIFMTFQLSFKLINKNKRKMR